LRIVRIICCPLDALTRYISRTATNKNETPYHTRTVSRSVRFNRQNILNARDRTSDPPCSYAAPKEFFIMFSVTLQAARAASVLRRRTTANNHKLQKRNQSQYHLNIRYLATS